jgi:hypothetical protein
MSQKRALRWSTEILLQLERAQVLCKTSTRTERDVSSALEVLVATESSGALPTLSPCFLCWDYGHFLKDCIVVAPHILDGIIARRSAYLANRRRQGSRRKMCGNRQPIQIPRAISLQGREPSHLPEN